MKRNIALMLTIILSMVLGACGSQPKTQTVTGTPFITKSPSIMPQTEPAQAQNAGELPLESEPNEVDNTAISITLTVGNAVFSLKLYDNDSSAAFLARLPMILNMSELNSNEKYYYLPDSLPTDIQRVENINAGDLMLYGSDCLVLFYESFSTSYSYTKLGYIEDVSGLAGALGGGSVQVSFAVEN